MISWACSRSINSEQGKHPYGYEAGEGTAYELCATFELATTERELRRVRPFPRRETGRHCFPLRVLPLFTVGDMYASLCKIGTYAPFSARGRSQALF